MNWEDCTTHVMSHGLHYGTGIFEGIRCYETKRGRAIFRLDAHLRRFSDSAGIYHMDLPYSRDELRDVIYELIKQNEFQDCYIRPLAYFGYNSLGVFPQGCPLEVVIGVWPWGAYLGEEGLEKGIKVMVSSWKKYNSSMMPTVGKACGQYMNSYLCVSDARNKGYDEAIMLDSHGDVSEGSGENIFIVRGDNIYTNDPASSILLGITRGSAIKIAEDLGYTVTIRKISRGELYIADEVFFTGTAAEVTPVIEIDNRPVGDGAKGKVTSAIQKRFFEIVKGERDDYDQWLDFVDA